MRNIYFYGVQQFFDIESKIIEQLQFELPQITEKYGTEEYSISLKKHKKNVKVIIARVFAQLKNATLNLFDVNSSWYKKLVNLEEEIINEYDSCKLDIRKIKKFYFKRMHNIDYVFLNTVRKTCVSYSNTIENPPVNEVYSIREYLFILKAYIVNNHNIINSIQVVNSKNSNLNRSITYRGECSKSSDMLYGLFPTNFNIGKTDIVSINNNLIILMLKNGEHAFTITINIGQNNALISYFIPEVYSVGAANSLPGLDAKVSCSNDWTSGSILCSLDLLTDILFNLISKVPSNEEEMLYEGFARKNAL